MIRYLLPALLAASAGAADHLPAPNPDGTFPVRSVWIEGGLGTSVTSGDVKAIDTGGGAFDQSLNSTWRPGMRGGIEVQTGWTDVEGGGLSLGFGIVAERSMGQIDSATTAGGKLDVASGLNVDAVSLVFLPGCTWRWDSGGFNRIVPRDWMLETAAIVGVGMAQAQVEGGSASNAGFAWQGGVRLRISTAVSRTMRVGLSLGGVYQEARVSWKNTGDSTFTSFGPIAALALGWEF